MNKSQHQKAVLSAFSLLIIFVALFTATAYHSHLKTIEINRADKISLVVLRNVEELFMDMANTETSYRGYILTSNKIFLEPYEQTLALYQNHLTELYSAQTGDLTEREHIKLLGQLAHAYVNFGKGLISKNDKNLSAGFDINKELVRGKEIMDSIRLVSALIENRERVNLALYDNQKADNARTVFVLILSSSIIALFIFFAFSVTIKKNVDKRLQAEEKLVSMNRQLEQKVADRTLELQNANDLLSSILNRISDGFVALDSNWCYTYVNKVAGQMLMREPASLIGKNVWDLFPEGRDLPFYQLCLNAVEKQEPVKIVEFYPPSGIWMENHIYPSPNGVSIYFTDISQRKKAEHEQQENERNLKQAEIAAKFGHWKLSLDEKKAYCSAGASNIYGTDKRIFTNEEVINFRLPEYDDMLNEAMRALIEDNKSFNTEFKIKRQSDGAIIDVQSVAEYNPTDHTVFGVIKDITESKNTERALEQEKNLSESIINSLPGVFTMFDSKGKIVRWNKNCETVSGYSPEEMRSMNTITLIDENDRGTAVQELKQSFLQGHGELESNLVTKSGIKIPYYFKARAENIHGETFFIWVGINISARKKAEESHMESEANLKRAEIVAKLGHWKMNIKDKLVYASEGTMKIYGVEKQVLTYEEVTGLRMPQYNETMNNALTDLIEKNKPIDVEYKIKNNKDGQILDVRLLSVYDAKTETLFGIVQDITERKKGEEEIKQLYNKLVSANAQLNTVLNTLPANIAVLDNQGKIISVNKAWQQFAQGNDLPGNKHGIDDNYITVCEHATADDKPIALKMATGIKQILNGKLDELSLEYPCHSPAEKRWFRAEVRPLEEGGNAGAVVMHVNITERKLAEETVNELNNQLEIRVMERTSELTQANKALEAFSYSVSHDLRAPVRAVIGFTRIIQSEYGDTLSPDLQELFSHIDSSGKRMNAIIDDMLTLAKYEKVQVNAVKVDMTKLFSQVWDNIQFSTHHRAKLLLSQLPEIEADQSMIEQVVVNLVSNAVKYSSKKSDPVITVGFKKSDTTITIFIKDNGAGFDMEHQDRLFGAFQRLHGSSEFEGTGVGLLLVKKIIERHGGQVWAKGEVEKGATFYFSLPLKSNTTN